MCYSSCCSKCCFIILRAFQLAFMIVTLATNAWLLNGFNSHGLLAPVYVLAMFIISVLGVAWIVYMAIFRSAPRILAESWLQLLIVEAAFFGFIIWAITRQAFVAGANCSIPDGGAHLSPRQSAEFARLAVATGTSESHVCSVLLTSFAFGILDAVAFFLTGIIVAMHWDRLRARVGYYQILPSYRTANHHRGYWGHRAQSRPCHDGEVMRRTYRRGGRRRGGC